MLYSLAGMSVKRTVRPVRGVIDGYKIKNNANIKK